MGDRKMSNPVSSQVQEVKSNTGFILFILFVLFAIIIGGVYYLISNNAFKSERLDGGFNMRGNLEKSSLDSKGILKLHLVYLSPKPGKFVDTSAKAYVGVGQVTAYDCDFVEYKHLEKGNNDTTLLNGQNFYLEFNCGSSYKMGEYIQGTFKYNVINPKTGIPIPVNGNFEFEVIE